MRLGIELTPSRCSLVGVQDGVDDPRIEDFHTIDYATEDVRELEGELRRLAKTGRFSGRASVVVWNSRAIHLTMSLPSDALEREDLAVARAKEEVPSFGSWASHIWAGVSTDRMFHASDLTPGRTLLFTAMSAEDVRRLLKPFVRAGFEIDRVMTPALALTGLAIAVVATQPNAVTAMVAMNTDMGVLAVLQGNRLLLERRLAWDFRVEHAAVHERIAERYSFLP